MSGARGTGVRKARAGACVQLRRCLGILILVFLIGAFGKCATAEEILPNGITPPSIATSLPYNGDPTGLRALMASYGATFNFIYVNDVLGNVNGGLRRGFIDQGLLIYNMTVDFEKLIGWQGLSFFTNGFLIHNTGRIRRDYVGGINTIAAIEAVPTGRLSELWLEQSFWNGGASLRAGQLAADVEFFYADFSFDVPADRLADDYCRSSPERRAGLSAVDAGRAGEGRSQQKRIGACRRV